MFSDREAQDGALGQPAWAGAGATSRTERYKRVKSAWVMSSRDYSRGALRSGTPNRSFSRLPSFSPMQINDAHRAELSLMETDQAVVSTRENTISGEQ